MSRHHTAFHCLCHSFVPTGVMQTRGVCPSIDTRLRRQELYSPRQELGQNSSSQTGFQVSSNVWRRLQLKSRLSLLLWRWFSRRLLFKYFEISSLLATKDHHNQAMALLVNRTLLSSLRKMAAAPVVSSRLFSDKKKGKLCSALFWFDNHWLSCLSINDYEY